MDDLFTLIVIIVAVLSVVGKLKTKPKAGQKAQPKGVSGWLAKLNAYLEEMQRQAKQAQAGEQAPDDVGAAQWRRLMEKDTVSIPPADEAEEELGDLEFVEIPEPPKAKPATEVARARAGLPPRPTAADPATRSEPQETEERPALASASRAELRQAIVWAEIIGPPVALKDPVSR